MFCELSNQKVPTKKWYLVGRKKLTLEDRVISLSAYRPFIVNVSHFVYNNRTKSSLCDSIVDLIYDKSGVEGVKLLRECALLLGRRHWRISLAAFAFLAHRGVYIPSGRSLVEDIFNPIDVASDLVNKFTVAGFSPAYLAKLAGISSVTIWNIRTKKLTRVRPYVEERLMRVYKSYKGVIDEKNK